MVLLAAVALLLLPMHYAARRLSAIDDLKMQGGNVQWLDGRHASSENVVRVLLRKPVDVEVGEGTVDITRIQAVRPIASLAFPIGSGLIDPHFRAIARMDELRSLTVDSEGHSAEGIRKLRSLQLEKLVLRGHATDEMGQAMSEIRSLHTLVINSWTFTDEGAKHLGRLRHLERVDLSGTSVTDVGVAFLLTLPELHELYLSYTGVTDDSIAALAKHPSLRFVDLEGTNVSTEGKQALRRQKPSILQHPYYSL